MATSIIYLISCCFIFKKNKDITYSKWGTCGVELRLSEEGNLEFCSSVISNKQIIWVSNFGGALNLPEIKDLSGRHYDLVKSPNNIIAIKIFPFTFSIVDANNSFTKPLWTHRHGAYVHLSHSDDVKQVSKYKIILKTNKYELRLYDYDLRIVDNNSNEIIWSCFENDNHIQKSMSSYYEEFGTYI